MAQPLTCDHFSLCICNGDDVVRVEQVVKSQLIHNEQFKTFVRNLAAQPIRWGSCVPACDCSP